MAGTLTRSGMNPLETNVTPPMRKLWILLAAVLFLSFAAVGWLVRSYEPDGIGQPGAAGAAYDGPREKQSATTAKALPHVDEQKALLRFFVLVGLARK